MLEGEVQLEQARPYGHGIVNVVVVRVGVVEHDRFQLVTRWLYQLFSDVGQLFLVDFVGETNVVDSKGLGEKLVIGHADIFEVIAEVIRQLRDVLELQSSTRVQGHFVMNEMIPLFQAGNGGELNLK